MTSRDMRFSEFALAAIVVHTITYFVVGLLALVLLDYAELYAQPDLALLMRPTTDNIVMAGPLFQPLRGLVFALVLYPLRTVIFQERHGWLVLWGLFVGLGIVSTFGPSPGSIEGLVFTVISVPHQLLGLSEVILQSLLLAAGLAYWVRHPERHWMRRVAYVVVVVLLSMPVAGLLVGPRAG